jgi:hypothetical protein
MVCVCPSPTDDPVGVCLVDPVCHLLDLMPVDKSTARHPTHRY